MILNVIVPDNEKKGIRYANNNDAYQTECLISAVVICCLGRITPLSVSRKSRFKLSRSLIESYLVESDFEVVSSLLSSVMVMSLALRKSAFCICENKDADQLRGDREADQRLCFRYTDSTIPLLPKYEISSLQPSTVIVQPGLCQTWSETPKTGFSQRGSYRTCHAIAADVFLVFSSKNLIVITLLQMELSKMEIYCMPYSYINKP